MDFAAPTLGGAVKELLLPHLQSFQNFRTNNYIPHCSKNTSKFF